jgi:hypothetical protein
MANKDGVTDGHSPAEITFRDVLGSLHKGLCKITDATGEERITQRDHFGVVYGNQSVAEWFSDSPQDLQPYLYTEIVKKLGIEPVDSPVFIKSVEKRKAELISGLVEAARGTRGVPHGQTKETDQDIGKNWLLWVLHQKNSAKQCWVLWG